MGISDIIGTVVKVWFAWYILAPLGFLAILFITALVVALLGKRR